MYLCIYYYHHHRRRRRLLQLRDSSLMLPGHSDCFTLHFILVLSFEKEVLENFSFYLHFPSRMLQNMKTLFLLQDAPILNMQQNN
jgi:hypothetical protein